MNEVIQWAAVRVKAAREESEHAAKVYFGWKRPDSDMHFDALRDQYLRAEETLLHDERWLCNLVLWELEKEAQS